jgi:hypothetical protein
MRLMRAVIAGALVGATVALWTNHCELRRPLGAWCDWDTPTF